MSVACTDGSQGSEADSKVSQSSDEKEPDAGKKGEAMSEDRSRSADGDGGVSGQAGERSQNGIEAEGESKQ